MKIIIAGGTGFLGRLLCQALLRADHQVTVLSRRPEAGGSRSLTSTGVSVAGWTPDGTIGRWASQLEGSNAVVNLCGESLAEGRWTPARKKLLRDSRVRPTQSLSRAIRAMASPSTVLVQGSAIGIYGDRGDEQLTERSLTGSGFLADLCVEWEAAAQPGTATRLVLLRSGLVLGPKGGVLAKMLPPFRLFAGGPLGSGRQFMSWIHHVDWVRLASWAIDTQEMSGPLNATAPTPVRNAEFSRALGRAIGRPSWLPAPAFALRVAFGEMADEALLAGQRVLPARALELGFHFAHPTIEEALGEIFGRH